MQGRSLARPRAEQHQRHIAEVDLTAAIEVAGAAGAGSVVEQREGDVAVAHIAVAVKVAEQEKLEVTNDDLNNFLYREAMRSGQKPDKLLKQLAGDREQLRSVQQSIIFDKAVDFLVSKATVTTVAPKA